MWHARGVAVGASSVVVAPKNPNRIALMFSVGDVTNLSSAVFKDQIDATASNGFPLSCLGGPFIVRGPAAASIWSAIRLAAVDCVVGVIEEFEDDAATSDVKGGI